MSQIDEIDKLMFDRALSIAKDPDSTVADREWVRKFMNDYHTRRSASAYTEVNALDDIKSLYGHVQFDLPRTIQEVDLQ